VATLLHPSRVVAVLSIALIGCADSSGTGGVINDIAGPSFSAAGPPLTGSGTGVITSLIITSSRTAGTNVIQTRRLEGMVDGVLQGTFTEDVRGVIHGNGLVTFQGTLEFTGSVADCPDVTGLTASIAGQGRAGLPVSETRWAVTGSTGGRVTGTGTIYQEGPALTYEGRYRCR
jgi:hypothetical protein